MPSDQDVEPDPPDLATLDIVQVFNSYAILMTAYHHLQIPCNAQIFVA